MRYFSAIALSVAAAAVGAAQSQNPFVGSWNLAGQAPDTAYVYWLEVKESNGQLSGMFLNRSESSAHP